MLFADPLSIPTVTAEPIAHRQSLRNPRFGNSNATRWLRSHAAMRLAGRPLRTALRLPAILLEHLQHQREIVVLACDDVQRQRIGSRTDAGCDHVDASFRSCWNSGVGR